MSNQGRDEASTPRRIGVREFRANMASILRRAQQGSSFLVTSRDEVLAEIRPPSTSSRPRRDPGALQNRIGMAPDFDTLSPDLLAAMEGDEG